MTVAATMYVLLADRMLSQRDFGGGLHIMVDNIRLEVYQAIPRSTVDEHGRTGLS